MDQYYYQKTEDHLYKRLLLKSRIIFWLIYMVEKTKKVVFDKFKNVKKLTEGGFITIYTAIWTRGYLYDYDENKNEFSYFGPQLVVLKSLNNSNNPGKHFFDEVIDII